MDIILLQKSRTSPNRRSRQGEVGLRQNFLCPPARPPWPRPPTSRNRSAAPRNSSEGRRGIGRGAGARGQVRDFKLELRAKPARRQLFGSIARRTSPRRRQADSPSRAAKCACPPARFAHRRSSVQLHLHTDVDVTLMSRSSPKSSGPARVPGIAHGRSPHESLLEFRRRPAPAAAFRRGRAIGARGLMLDAAAWTRCRPLVAEDFYRNDHRLISRP